jgi:hypothetical protein
LLRRALERLKGPVVTVFHISEINPEDCAECLITMPEPCGYHAGWSDGWGAACDVMASHMLRDGLVDQRGR